MPENFRYAIDSTDVVADPTAVRLDFCPTYSTPIANRRCTDPESVLVGRANFFGEVFGARSRCFDAVTLSQAVDGYVLGADSTALGPSFLHPEHFLGDWTFRI